MRAGLWLDKHNLGVYKVGFKQPHQSLAGVGESARPLSLVNEKNICFHRLFNKV